MPKRKMRVPRPARGALGALLVLGAASTATSAAAQAPARVAPDHPITLLEAIALGRANGVSGALAQLSARAADARVAQRRGDLLPQISAGASYTRQTVNLDEFGIPFATGVTPGFDLYRLQIRAAQTILDPSLLTRLRAAKDTALAAGLDARAIGEIAGATAGLAYLRALSADETVRAREADSSVAASLLDQAKKMVDAGVSPAIDATRSEVSYAAVRTQLEVARNTRDRSRLDLARALDLPAGTPIELADSLGLDAIDLPTDPAGAATYAREHRTELAAERARTKGVQRALGAIRAENLPSLAANGQYLQSGQATDVLAGSYAVQLVLSVPILDGFKRQNRAKEQSFRLEAQQLRERDVTNQVETEARQAALDLKSAEQQVSIARDRMRLAEQELAQADERFRAGVAGSVETTNAQSSVIAARDALIQARVNYGSARVSAYRALGVIDQLH